jgi:hypothetical protein
MGRGEGDCGKSAEDADDTSMEAGSTDSEAEEGSERDLVEMPLSLSYMFILLRTIHQMFIDEAACAENCTFFLSAQSCTISLLRHHI